VLRAGLRALLAPTIDAQETAPRAPEERIHFDAVAVTAETRAAVAAMALLPFAAVLGIQVAHLGDTSTMIALGAYAAIAASAAFAFRRASRVAIGVDGILLTGTSRTRFFAFLEDLAEREEEALLAEVATARSSRRR
jgi:hypothetical protein